MQSVLPDSELGRISDWDSYLIIDLDRADLPYKSPSEFILNEDFHKLVLASKLPRPGKFVDQSIAFCKTFCKLLLGHEIIKSDLIRGLSAFDSSVMIESSEEHYAVAIEKMPAYFSNAGWVSASDKVKITSQYRSYITKLRADPLPDYDDWVHFLSTHYEIRCRPELCQLHKYSCVYLPPLIEMPPSLENNTESFRSCLRSLQASYLTIPHVSSLYRDANSISPGIPLLGRGADLLTDRIFFVWIFLKGSSPRRATLLGKLETGYRKAVLRTERPPITSSSTTPSVSRHSSVNSSPSPDPSLIRVNLEVPRLATWKLKMLRRK